VGSYTVIVAQQSGAWVAAVPALGQVHARAGNLARLTDAIRREIVRSERLPDGAEAGLDLNLEYEGIDDIARAAARVGQRRLDLDRLNESLVDETASLARRLADAGWSVRDIGHLLQISPGRVSQIGSESATRDRERLHVTEQAFDAALRARATGPLRNEIDLRQVVEAAGILAHAEFRVGSPEAGPDLVVRLPGGSAIAIDGKVPGEEAGSIRPYLDVLATYLGTPPDRPMVVVAYLPSERRLRAVLTTDPGALDHAHACGAAIASPVTLYSVLCAVAAAWGHETLVAERHPAAGLNSGLESRFRDLATRVVFPAAG
jgi:DNA recombination protein RmuC